MTAKIVIASAKRLIDVRQPCLSSSRIAEISVPAWPMPIHQTKLMIAKPQPTGMLTPQMPVPFQQQPGHRHPEHPHEQEADRRRRRTRRSAAGVSRTTPLILSVIEPNVCPGSMSGGVT